MGIPRNEKSTKLPIGSQTDLARPHTRQSRFHSVSHIPHAPPDDWRVIPYASTHSRGRKSMEPCALTQFMSKVIYRSVRIESFGLGYDWVTQVISSSQLSYQVHSIKLTVMETINPGSISGKDFVKFNEIFLNMRHVGIFQLRILCILGSIFILFYFIFLGQIGLVLNYFNLFGCNSGLRFAIFSFECKETSHLSLRQRRNQWRIQALDGVETWAAACRR